MINEYYTSKKCSKCKFNDVLDPDENELRKLHCMKCQHNDDRTDKERKEHKKAKRSQRSRTQSKRTKTFHLQKRRNQTFPIHYFSRRTKKLHLRKFNHELRLIKNQSQNNNNNNSSSFNSNVHHSQLKKNTNKRAQEKSNTFDVFGVLVCNHCHTTWSRDVNASLNIFSVLITLPTRPSYLCKNPS